ncbi:uncharacterized protein PITG_02942 [Phytophthora infestans T30-4]|uniref:Uncharacterized protein n=1 Tax=Phytophthora infestans (strain T30-4) TaxID=403677 RepID=D0MXJ7_PHYIT|nr:uncharacterized protein PITG_02942 [Phytophthora infestans T30-4]EEY64360.1 conserved hypothetical protein [Phytophthora infestans T30-4]|eukprot:XP_002907796.1 conserved hypothetical protein [Phytophthora infestans T30-4]
MVEIARGRLAVLRAQEETNISAASFRLLLVEGFSASKVCISGALKTIQLRLVRNTEAGECYLTWTPSRKKKPRINLHDIEQVIAIRKEGNSEAPRLSKKVSHRRGIILVCKSYHRGRIVLEVTTKRERNVLLQGFQHLLREIVSTESSLDDIGALRSQQPRRQSTRFCGYSVRADAKAIEHFYQTRFDDSPDSAISHPSQSSRPSRAMEVRH